MENPLEQKLDGFQSKVGQQFDSLQCPISKLAQQLDQKGEKNPEEVCLIGTMVEEQCQQQGLSGSSYTYSIVCPWEKEEEITTLLTKEGSGKENGEEPQNLILHLNPINLDPTATAQATKSPLPVAPSIDQVYILPAAQSQHKTPEAPTTKATASLLVLQNIRKLVATVRAFATTSKTQAAAHIAWHSGWFGCRFGFGAPEHRHF